MTEAILALGVVNLAGTASLAVLVGRTLKEERARSDRFAAAALFVQGEGSAAKVVAAPKPPAGPADGRVRPQQIGLTGR